MNVEVFFSLLGTVLGLGISVLTMLIKICKNRRWRKSAEAMEEIQAKIKEYMGQAEKFIHYTGEEKKEYVLRKLNELANENKIKVNPSLMEEKIEELITFSNQVNTSKKDKGWI